MKNEDEKKQFEDIKNKIEKMTTGSPELKLGNISLLLEEMIGSVIKNNNNIEIRKSDNGQCSLIKLNSDEMNAAKRRRLEETIVKDEFSEIYKKALKDISEIALSGELTIEGVSADFAHSIGNYIAVHHKDLILRTYPEKWKTMKCRVFYKSKEEVDLIIFNEKKVELEELEKNLNAEIKASFEECKEEIRKQKEEVNFPRLKMFVARLVKLFLKTSFPKSVFEEKPIQWLTNLTILNLTPEQLAERKRQASRDILAEVENMVGFRRAWKAITDASKPIVVHNGFVDIMYVIHHFDEPLPETLEEFKLMKNRIMPEVYDTKYMAENLWGIPNSGLEQLLKSPIFEQEVTFLEKLKNEKFHDAGCDAFNTGKIFASTLENFEKNKNKIEQKKNLIPLHATVFHLNTNCFEENGQIKVCEDGVSDSTFILYVHSFSPDFDFNDWNPSKEVN
eukprot:GHVL01021677.1.p1 GENE.GHVL01021677.1~~GHVL01021677.1.p1  ORF type:complete len:449 (+),score=90.23 GHVL01021677.1:586-1932(+)